MQIKAHTSSNYENPNCILSTIAKDVKTLESSVKNGKASLFHLLMASSLFYSHGHWQKACDSLL